VWQGEECFVADLIDVSEEMATQQALAAREQLLAQLAQALPLGVFQIDSDHRLVYTNDCLFEVTGSAGATDFDGLLRCVARDDRAKIQAALEAVMREGSDAELSVGVAGPNDDVERVCQFTLRRLTSDASARPGAVGCVVDITEQTTLRRELEDRATFDPLTRCYNRASVMSLLDDMLRTTTTRSGSGTAVLFIDFDRFKGINDRYGHHVGDEFLTAIAARIRGGLRDGAALGRIGGDEFLVVLPYIGSAREAAVVAQRVFESLQRDVALSVGVEPCNASIGLAVHTSAHATAEDLVNQADAAMYEAKAAGGNRIVSATTNAA
jgi:diguanylate cyclase (GGDEF)-like protein